MTDFINGNTLLLKKYEYLIGKTRKEVIASLGQEFNYYHGNVWKYMIRKNWLGLWLILVITFEGETVKVIGLKKQYVLNSQK